MEILTFSKFGERLRGAITKNLTDERMREMDLTLIDIGADNSLARSKGLMAALNLDGKKPIILSPVNLTTATTMSEGLKEDKIFKRMERKPNVGVLPFPFHLSDLEGMYKRIQGRIIA